MNKIASVMVGLVGFAIGVFWFCFMFSVLVNNPLVIPSEILDRTMVLQNSIISNLIEIGVCLFLLVVGVIKMVDWQKEESNRFLQFFIWVFLGGIPTLIGFLIFIFIRG